MMPHLETLTQAVRLARRELRGGLRGFGVFLACLFLGVFAISAIGSFTESAKSGLLADASALLGGDLEVRLAHRELQAEQQAFLARQGHLSHVMTMRTMAADFNGEQRLLIELKAVDANYPLYGEIGIKPDISLQQALDEKQGAFGALVESSLLDRLGIRVGDQVRVGDGRFQVRGVLTVEPDRNVRAFSLGPRFLVNQAGLAATRLVQPGSLVNHAYRLQLADKERVDVLKADLQAAFPDAGWRLRTWREAAPRVRFFLDRMNLNLTLIGLCALLVGGLGVSGAVRGYLTGKTLHIATMKCLGASGGVIFTAYLLQVIALGLVGAIGGLTCGAAIPFLLSWLIGDRLPIPLAPAVHVKVLMIAALFGLLIALVFSLKALGIARRVPPGVLFRGYSETLRSHPGKSIWLAIGLATLALALLAVYTSTDRRLALWFIAGAGLCFGIFRLTSVAVIRLARLLPRPAVPALRLGLGNIHRRGSPAGSALFSLGLGLTALVIVSLVQANLDDLVSETVPRQAPAFFFLDIQMQQVETFEKLAHGLAGVTRVERYPTLRGRITAIDGLPVDQATIDPEVQWAVQGDRYLSYAADVPPDTVISAGAWWPIDYSGPPKVSLTADVARGFGVGVGDSLTVNVLGRDITAEIASLRDVDWTTLDLNFAILFAPGVLEGAPQTYIATIHVPPDREEAVYRTMTREFSNVSAISTREVLKNVARTLERIGAAFRGMAAVALLTGFLVLAGAVSADQHRRIHDAVIFKICGATRLDILTAFAAEFLLLGLIAGVISALVGSLAAMGILKGLMHTSFSVHSAVLLSTLLLGIVLTLFLGLLGTWKALGHKPAKLLRRE
jgi:putative ABC transport system permease protein